MNTILRLIRKHFPDPRITELEQELDKERARVDTIVTQLDVRQLMRLNLGLVDLRLQGHQNPLNGLTEEQIKEFELWGSAVKQSRWWSYLTSHVINKQTALTLGKSLSSESATWAGAGFVDAVIELSQEVERLATARERRLAGEDPYDEDYLIQN